MPNRVSARDLELYYCVTNVCYSDGNAEFYRPSVGARIVETRRNDIIGVVKTLGLNTKALHGMSLNRHRFKAGDESSNNPSLCVIRYSIIISIHRPARYGAKEQECQSEHATICALQRSWSFARHSDEKQPNDYEDDTNNNKASASGPGVRGVENEHILHQSWSLPSQLHQGRAILKAIPGQNRNRSQ